LGDGSSPRSLSRAGIRRLDEAASSPTLFSAAYGVIGLVAGPSSLLRRLNSRVRPLSSLGLMVAPSACKPGQDTPVIAITRLHRFAPGRPPLERSVGPVQRVWPLTSQAAFRSQASGAFASPAFRKVATRLARARCPSRCGRPFWLAFRQLSGGRCCTGSADSSHTVLVRSSSRAPSG
jgi:hypothetical protein